MAVDITGILNPYDASAQIVNDIHTFAINWYVNRTPLASRLPRLPATSDTFSMVNRAFRGRTATLAAAVTAVSAGTVATITVDDASRFMVGDVIEITKTDGTATERAEVQADPASSTTVSVKRGVEGTTPVANDISANTTIYLIGNSRTGAEVDQSALAYKPVAVAQYCQTFQHSVQVGGSAQATPGMALAPGVSSPFDQNKMEAMQNLMDDIEGSSYYGIGEARSSTTSRPKQKGLKTLITTNKTLTPTNAGAYKPTDFIRDTMEKCFSNGGNPDVVICSTNFMTGLATWGHAAQRIDAGRNVFGTPIDVFEAPFLAGVRIIPSPLLRNFTALCLTSAEVRMRMKRNEFWQPRGNRGDAVEGDWIAEGAIELENEAHHAWLQGITAFSAT